MSEKSIRRTLNDFLGLPNGREEYVKFMVAYEAAENLDTRFTQQENEELFGLQFDLAAKLRELDRKLISQEDFEKYKTEHDQRVDEIVAKSRARNEAANEAWEVHDKAEVMMDFEQESPNAEQLETALRRIENEKEIKKTFTELHEDLGLLHQAANTMQVLAKDMAEQKLGNMTGAEKGGEVIFKLGDEVMYNGERCTVIGVEDAGGSFYSSESLASDNASRAGHSQRLRLRENKWKSEYYPISGANCTKV